MRFYESTAIAPLRDRILGIIYEKLGYFQERTDPTASFLEEIGADSLDTVEFIMAVEEEFDITVSDEDAEKIKTIGDAFDFLAKRKL
jgi:acyl carrier protein